MTGKNLLARRSSGVTARLALVTALVLGFSFYGGALALGGPASSAVAGMATPHRVSAPLKPNWVEALLDARATALRSLLEAHDLLSAPHRPQTAAVPPAAPERGAAPLKPDWVEALLDARATALRSLLEAHALETAPVQP